MSNNLDLAQIAASQLSKEVTQNQAHGEIDAALTEASTFLITSSNALTLTDAQYRANNSFQFDDDSPAPNSQITITVPAIKRGYFLIFNNTTFPLIVQISGQSLSATVIVVGERVVHYSDGTNVIVPVAIISTGLEALNTAAAQAVPAFRGCSLSKTGAQAISGASATDLTWEGEDFDTDTFHDNVTNNDRITIPVGSGITKVLVTCNLDLSTPTTGSIQGYITLNGGAFPGIGGTSTEAFSGSELLTFSTGPIEVSEGDIFRAAVFFANAGSIDTSTGTKFSLQVLESNLTGTTLGLPPFEGARAYLVANQSIPDATATVINWTTEDFDTNDFHDNSTNNSRMTVPTGVTKVILRTNIRFETFGSDSQGDVLVRFKKGGSTSFRGNAAVFAPGPAVSNLTPNVNMTSGIIDCVATDYFEVEVFHNMGNAKDIESDSGFRSWFEIQVVERTSTPHYDLEHYHSGTPSSSQLIRRWSIPRTMIMPDGMTDSSAWANTAPSGQTDFDVQRNGVSVGTIRFAGASNTATFINSGDDTFSPGDRLEIVAPGALNSIADISFAVAFRRSF